MRIFFLGLQQKAATAKSNAARNKVSKSITVIGKKAKKDTQLEQERHILTREKKQN